MALTIAVDVNRYSDFCRGETRARQMMESAPRIVMPFVVLAELRAGFARGSASRKNETALGIFLASPRVSVVFADEATTHFYASLHCDLKLRGTPIPTNDVWIAALVLQHDLVLFSRDTHFDRIPRLPRV